MAPIVSKFTELQNPENFKLIKKDIIYIEGAARNVKNAEAMQLSCFDGAFINVGCVQMGSYFYSKGLDVQQLMAALATNLQRYPVLAGRIIKQRRSKDMDFVMDDRVAVQCCNSGVEFYQQFSTLYGKQSFNVPNMVRKDFKLGQVPPYFQNINLKRTLVGQEPLMKLVHTQFADGSSVLSMSMSHLIADGMSLIAFVSDLGRIYSGVSDLQAPVLHRNDFVGVKKPDEQPSPLVPSLPPPGWLLTIKSLWNLWGVNKAEAKIIPSSGGKFSVEILHIPKEALDRLRTHINKYCAEGCYVGPNDVAAAFVWTLLCDIRGRKLPGEAQTDEEAGRFMMALDMRQAGESISQRFFGNASWVLHVSCPASGSVHIPTIENEQQAIKNTREVKAVIGAALKLRQSVNDSRNGGIVPQIVDKAPKAMRAPLSSKLSMLAQVCSKVDGFMTSLHFPLSYLKFGDSTPEQWHSLLDPYNPYHCSLVPAVNKKDGVYLFIVVPSTASDALKQSRVAKTALPEAKFL